MTVSKFRGRSILTERSLPLLELLINDFPTSSRDRLLSDSNAQKVLAADTSSTTVTARAVLPDTVALYISYLVQLGFMPKPSQMGKSLPEVKVGEEQLQALRALGGRGKVA